MRRDDSLLTRSDPRRDPLFVATDDAVRVCLLAAGAEA